MSATLQRMLLSIAAQSYDNWKIVVTDDVSDKDHLEKSIEIVKRFYDFIGKENHHKFVFCGNTRKKWEVENVLTMLRADCEDDDIVCRIDADDWLTDLDALTIIDAAYKESGCDILWTNHRWAFSDRNISGPMPPGADPYRHPWVSSHLKTFRKYLLNGVNDKNYRGPEGEYIKRAGDQAIYLPALYKSKKHAHLPRCMYHYSIKDVPETYQTPDARFQRDEALFLRARGFIE